MATNKVKSNNSTFIPRWTIYLTFFLFILPIFIGLGRNGWIGWMVGLFFGVLGLITSIIIIYNKQPIITLIILLPISIASLVFGYQTMTYDYYNQIFSPTIESGAWITNQTMLRPWTILIFGWLLLGIGGIIILSKYRSKILKSIKDNIFKSIVAFCGILLILTSLIINSSQLYNSTEKKASFIVQNKNIRYGRNTTVYEIYGTVDSNQVRYDVSKFIYRSISIEDKVEIIYESPSNTVLKLRITR